MNNELWRMSALQLAELIRTRKASSREVVQAHLDRMAEVNPKINAVTCILAETALAAADRADAEDVLRPFHGVPFTVKENIDCLGSATTQGLPAMKDVMPTLDAPVVARMKAAGAIPIGRTNLPEFGLRITTDNPLRGRTLNPFSESRTAGGSSGGEGAALACGMSPIGLGNDIGGSLRNPAVCCGITSLKPSAGRIPNASSIPPNTNGLAGQVMAVQGPMARHVADLQAAYRILSGRDIRDPGSVDAPLFGPMPANKRVALVTEIPGVKLPSHIIASVRAAGKAMVDSGWQVEEVTPPELERVTEIWAHILSAEFESTIDVMAEVMSEPAVNLLRGIIRDYPPADMPTPVVHGERWRLATLWSAFLADFPLIVGPTWTDIPFLHDADIAEDGVATTVNMLRFITPANLLGLPAAAVPDQDCKRGCTQTYRSLQIAGAMISHWKEPPQSNG